MRGLGDFLVRYTVRRIRVLYLECSGGGGGRRRRRIEKVVVVVVVVVLVL